MVKHEFGDIIQKYMNAIKLQPLEKWRQLLSTEMHPGWYVEERDANYIKHMLFSH